MTKEQELLTHAELLITLLKNEKQSDSREFNIIINKMAKILGPTYNNIPSDLKKGLGVAYASSLAETEIISKTAYTRSSLSLLRAAVKIAHGPTSQLEMIDKYIQMLEKEIKLCETSGDEATLDGLWKLTNRVGDYLSLLVFSGYGEIQGRGFSFTRRDPTTSDGGIQK
ncbi:MAG: hypothetical protein WC998_05720 [Candidatus Paceibacterota bacterium]